MPAKPLHDFVNAINTHDVNGLYSLMADDHVFIDAHGNQVSDKDKMKAGWAGYFTWFPDYTIEIVDVFVNANVIAAFGFASGTFKGLVTPENENYWRLPAAWKVVAEHDKIKLWQVFCDTKIPFDILAKNKAF